MLLRAARRLLRTRGYDDVTLAAILTESNLHTRAFYRHFRSKEELFLTIYRENGEELSSILQARVDAAASPPDAVAAWIDELLRLHFEPRTVAHVSVYREAVIGMRQGGILDTAVPRFLEPLRQALAAGKHDGTLPYADPDTHAAMIWSLVWSDLAWAEHGRADQRWATARERLTSFVMSGLGGPAPTMPDTPRGRPS